MIEQGIKKSLKNKKLIFASWGCKIQTSQECRDWPPIFKKLFKEVILFSLKNEQYYYGTKELNKKFIDLIKKEKPDYLFIIPSYDELYVSTLKKLKKINPNMKTIIQFGDDEFRFDDWSRYYSLFFDYILTTKKELDIYEKENIKATFMIGVNPEYHKPLNTEKIYDVTFIGTPLRDRYEYIKHLKDNGINIKLFGGGWDSYKDLEDIYGGFLYPEDFIKKINQSKINLNFSKTFFYQGTGGQMKGRPIEVLACKSFTLNEFTDKSINYLVNKKEINFKTKKELLKKVKYYLKNKKEREKLTEEGYKHILENYNWEEQFIRFFNKIEKDPIRPPQLPKINKKTILLSSKDLKLNLSKLKEKIKDYDYIHFSKNPHKIYNNKEYFQSYSLNISKKDISLCDYYIYKKGFGNYLSLLTKKAFFTLEKEDFNKVFNLNQIMVTKNFFIKNINSFKDIKKLTNLINKDNTVFVSIPLVEVHDLNSINYEDMKNVFKPLFFSKIFSLAYQKKIFDPFLINILIKPVKGRIFMTKYLLKKIFKKSNWQALDFFH